MPKQNIINQLIILDVIWSTSALIYDWQKLALLPGYLWPFFAICPIYPFLLAVYWTGIRRSWKNDYLAAFTILPAVTFLAGSLGYYPYWILANGFEWLALGQIFWIAVYGLQAIYLLARCRFHLSPFYVASLYLATNLSILIVYRNNGYFNTDGFSTLGFITIISLMLIVMILTILKVKRNSPHSYLRAIPTREL